MVFAQFGRNSDKLRNRSDAISALTVLDSDRKAVSLIEGALADKDDGIRFLAATSLGNIKARSSIPKLKAAMDDPSAQVSFAAAQALWKMDDRSGREILYEVLDGERKTGPGLIKSKMNKAKQEMHDPKALALLGINEASGALLGPFSMGVSMVEEYATNHSAPVQVLCAQLLTSDHSGDTLEELRSALSDKNWAVRASAVRALAKLNDVKSIPEMKDIMENDKTQSARFVAAAAVVRLNEHSRRSPASVPQPSAPTAEKRQAPGTSAAGTTK